MTKPSQWLMPIPTMSETWVSSSKHVALPDVRCDLVWVGGKLWLTGPQTRCHSNFPGRLITLATLEPLLASAWLNTPLSEMTDRLILLADINPALAARLSEAFAGDALRSVWGPIGGGAGWLPDKRLNVAISLLRRGTSVAAAAAALSLTPRHLVRLFDHQMGLRPRHFARIVRLRRAVFMIKRGATIADAAAGAGFADQSHFTREVNTFAGRSPTALIPYVANVQDDVKDGQLD